MFGHERYGTPANFLIPPYPEKHSEEDVADYLVGIMFLVYRHIGFYTRRLNTEAKLVPSPRLRSRHVQHEVWKVLKLYSPC